LYVYYIVLEIFRIFRKNSYKFNTIILKGVVP
jgi:hypothetical protein